MDKASEFDGQRSRAIPANQVLAIITDSDEARSIVGALRQSGFSSDDIGILTGKEDAEKLDVAAGKKGLFAKLLSSGLEMGDRDTDYLKLYRRALLNGRAVLGVTAKNDEARSSARKILKARGARLVVFFGQFVTEVLEP